MSEDTPYTGLKYYKASPYPYDYTFIFNLEDVNSYVGILGYEGKRLELIKNKILKIGKDVLGCCTMVTMNNYVIYVNYQSLTDKALREKTPAEATKKLLQGVGMTITHECAHFALRVAGGIGYDPTNESEPFCYLLGKVSAELWDEFLEYDFNKRRIFGPSLGLKKTYLEVEQERDPK